MRGAGYLGPAAARLRDCLVRRLDHQNPNVVGLVGGPGWGNVNIEPGHGSTGCLIDYGQLDHKPLVICFTSEWLMLAARSGLFSIAIRLHRPVTFVAFCSRARKTKLLPDGVEGTARLVPVRPSCGVTVATRD